MLTAIHITIICISCNYREHTKCTADVVYTYFVGIRLFFQISFGANKAGLTFYVISLHYMEYISIVDCDNGDSELRKVESMANNELQRNMMREREREKEIRLVNICTYQMATLYLKKKNIIFVD